MPDLPDWYQGFQLVGSDITINVNIKASDVILPISIASAITLDVNLVAQEANITISFADQSVAVFDAAKWFAHEAQQVYVMGASTVPDGSFGVTATRAVSGGRTYFVTWIGGGVNFTGGVHVALVLRIDTVELLRVDGVGGQGVTFDTPVRVENGETVDVLVGQWAGEQAYCVASIGGYDEA